MKLWILVHLNLGVNNVKWLLRGERPPNLVLSSQRPSFQKEVILLALTLDGQAGLGQRVVL